MYPKNLRTRSIIISLVVILIAGISLSYKLVERNLSNDVKVNNASYWDEGLAELSTYRLIQNRYGDMHPGKVVMIFVKEDFLTDKQVKNETYTNPASTPVLKNLQSRKFATGIYDYTMATTSFTAFDQNQFPGPLKIQSVSTEWCGTSYTQLNRTKSGFNVELRSYFEKEGDQDYSIRYALSEDDIFNQIRIDPDGLPQGKINAIPSAQSLRLTHLDITPYEAQAVKSDYSGNEFDETSVQTFTLSYPAIGRTLTIYFDKAFPHSIKGWDEAANASAAKDSRTTSARLTHQIRKDYWRYNGNEDVGLREQLGLN